MTESDRLKPWRLVLGSDAEDSCGAAGLVGGDLEIDRALAALYQSGDTRSGGLGGSAPRVARWLGDIRTYFPSSVVQVMQRDALERLNLQQMLLEPEMMQAVEPDVHLVANLMSLSQIMPAKTKETARLVVQKVVDELLPQAYQPHSTSCLRQPKSSRPQPSPPP
jgi:hypothetical protein